MRSAAALAVVTVLPALLLSGCLASSTGNDASSCGSDMVTARLGQRSTALLSCGGLAGLHPLPHLTLDVGQTMTLDDRVGGTISLSGTGLTASGSRYTGTRAGDALLSLRDGDSCGVRVARGAPCPLVRVTVMA